MSRARGNNTFGRCTEELKVFVDEETKNSLTMLASAADLSISEYIRNLIHGHVHGHARVLRSRMDALVGRADNRDESGSD